jgi:hypothetical protein
LSGERRGFRNLDVYITIDQAPADSQYFWAHQFWFVGGKEGGYMGLQTGGVIHGINRGKIAIFSIWDATDTELGPPACAEHFSENGTGWGCKLPFDWRSGTTYRLRVGEVGNTSDPNAAYWWGSSVLDTQTNEEHLIGKIRVPAEWEGLKSETGCWIEHFGALPDCESLPYTRAVFGRPQMNDGTTLPDSFAVKTYGDCAHRARMTKGEQFTCTAETGVSA